MFADLACHLMQFPRNFESRGTTEGGALEGDALDAGVFNEPFDDIRGDFARDFNLLHRYTQLHA